MKKGKNDIESTEFLGKIVPHVEQLALNQEEYIRTLEMSIKLLQREVENLRQKPRPQSLEEGSDETISPHSLTHTAKLIQSFSTSELVISALQEYASLCFPVIDSGMFLVSPNSSTLLPAIENTSPTLCSIEANLEEEGIIDWALEQKNTVVIPNLVESRAENRTNFVLIPLFLRGTPVGLFIAQTTMEAAEFEKQDFNSLSMLAESAAIAIDNIRSATEIRQMNLRLNSLNKQMMQSAKLASIGELAGSIAHEINNPLQILIGHLQLLENGVGDPVRRMSIIKEQVYRISDITRRLLDFARSAPADINPESINIDVLLRDVLLFVGSQLRRDGVEIEKEIAQEIGKIRGIKAQLEQVFLNILINARDAMPNGGKIMIAAFPEQNGVAITIADTGMGIASDDVEHIFEPFFTTKPQGKGTGLGLSISRQIVQQHNGKITVLSDIGKGTTFKIWLPQFRDEKKIPR